MTGYELRNAANPSLCLTVADTGPSAGQLREPAEVAACKLTANQIWIPEEWETEGKSYAHLVSDKYQTMCLNSRKSNGAPTGPGDVIMLYRCYYPAGNEAWAVQAWYQSVAYPPLEPGSEGQPVLVLIILTLTLPGISVVTAS
jgi:hypothetical protein